MIRAALGALSVAAACLLPACTSLDAGVARRVDAMLPVDLILLGEQHDAPDHQRLQRAIVLDLARRGQLAALAVEMAEQGRSTAALARDATEHEIRLALHWSDAAWPWESYGPVILAAVRAGVPVLGANLARDAMRTAMVNEKLDAHLSPRALEQQRENIRIGHCGLLPESQIAPMTRIQIARDAAMAGTLVAASQPGKTVLLIAGGAHVERELGVPTHLPAAMRSKVVLAVAGQPQAAEGADLVWETPSVPPKDHCAGLADKLKP